MASWDVNRVKAQLRLTAQRLGQLQDKLEAQAQITRKDIATLLHQGNLILARAKAQKLIREDIYGDLLQNVEMHVGIILEHMGDFERSRTPSPVVVEAASSIIFAAPRTDSRDLHIVREMLMQQLGPDFSRAASDPKSGYISARVVRAITTPPPSATTLDRFLSSIARTHNINWQPDLQPHEKVDAISSMLDPSSAPEIDMSRLRALCSHGLPEYPPWLRPRVWRLLLGTLPLNKTTWSNDAKKQRDNYYDLLRRLLQPFGSLPPPTQPLTALDATLMEASNALSRVPRDLYAKLEEEPDKSDSCPLDETAPEDIKISCAGYLDARVRIIRDFELQGAASAQEDIPEIRLEDQAPKINTDLATPEISLSAPESPSSSSVSAPTTLLPSRSYTATAAHPRHASALLRLLYVHSTLNPANRSPQIASLLVPLYTALIQEIEPADAAHCEADAFWLFETMVGEFSELEDVEGARVWMRKFSERLRYADTELAEDLQIKGLDPVLPHYSYRWLTTLLTHALPLSDVLAVWDAIFSRPMRARDSNPKLDYLLDVCISMILCTRGSLIRLGRPPVQYMNADENATLIATPLGERELDEAFVQGMALLQAYPLRDAGGVDRILQLAFDLSKQRETQATSTANKAVGGFAARWRNTMWKPAAPAPIAEVREEEDSDSDTDSDDDYEHTVKVPVVQEPPRSTFGSRLADTVWKGITNQSAMEPPPSPGSPAFSPSPSPSPIQSPARLPAPLPAANAEAPVQESSDPSGSKRSSGLWAYAEKLRDSDAAATLSKVSTNWRVKAWDAWNKRGSIDLKDNPPAPAASSTLSPSWVPSPSTRNSLEVRASPRVFDPKRSSLPEGDMDGYSPPPMPAFFRSPRDSILPWVGRRESMGLDRIPSPGSATRSGGPRPLLLNSASLITHSRSPTPSASATDTQFARAVRERRPQHRSSQSSLSSLSPSEQTSSSRPHTTDTTISRVVPLNRKTPSPMARTRRQESLSSVTVSSPSGSVHRLPADTSPESDERQAGERREWRAAEAANIVRAVASQPSPPLPGTPPSANVNGSVRVVASESQRGSVVLSEFGRRRLNHGGTCYA
ncbi:hypothetical protein NM688_g6119 [Phlebia brevispora]|uniref:Uncharacterized protein n=1 Tax=Phlebia brevispora TaxID=194682 RepID=A0ACC1SJM2_9APHY|nr:hypothetical protein NM688_g6119 [Phlebia brevispora]